MKIAFTSKGTKWDSKMDPRFGRTEFILIYDEEKIEEVSPSFKLVRFHLKPIDFSRFIRISGLSDPIISTPKLMVYFISSIVFGFQAATVRPNLCAFLTTSLLRLR